MIWRDRLLHAVLTSKFLLPMKIFLLEWLLTMSRPPSATYDNQALNQAIYDTTIQYMRSTNRNHLSVFCSGARQTFFAMYFFCLKYTFIVFPFFPLLLTNHIIFMCIL